MPRRPSRKRCRTAEDHQPSDVDNFDARAWFLATAQWAIDWPDRLVRELEDEGFSRVKLEQIVPHPVWHLRFRCPGRTLSSRQAGRIVRRIIRQEGTIPTGGFFCFIPRQGAIEAAFVMEV